MPVSTTLWFLQNFQGSKLYLKENILERKLAYICIFIAFSIYKTPKLSRVVYMSSRKCLHIQCLIRSEPNTPHALLLKQDEGCLSSAHQDRLLISIVWPLFASVSFYSILKDFSWILSKARKVLSMVQVIQQSITASVIIITMMLILQMIKL